MLLRGSGEHQGVDFDLADIVRDKPNEDDAGVESAALLTAYADAFYSTEPAALERTRNALVAALGSAAMIDAAGIVGMFDAVVKVADATGITLEPVKAEASAEFRRALGIDALPH